MKTDALFYQLFQTLPDLFFELANLPYSDSYQFQAVELKQTAFRIDGIFVSAIDELPLIFVEVHNKKMTVFMVVFSVKLCCICINTNLNRKIGEQWLFFPMVRWI
jgi:hypothetical protein